MFLVNLKKTNIFNTQRISDWLTDWLIDWLTGWLIDVAVSCPDVTAPKGGQVRRTNDDTAIVTCLNSDEVWYLTCKGVKWAGTYGNCSHGQGQLTSLSVAFVDTLRPHRMHEMQTVVFDDPVAWCLSFVCYAPTSSWTAEQIKVLFLV